MLITTDITEFDCLCYKVFNRFGNIFSDRKMKVYHSIRLNTLYKEIL